MAEWVLHHNPTASWHHLIGEAQERSQIHLSVDLESYLVFLLMRYTTNPALAASVIGLEYLEGLQLRADPALLKDVGDKCLLFAGLFPERAERRRLQPSYYLSIGQSAFEVLAQDLSCPIAQLYNDVASSFPSLKEVLTYTRPGTIPSPSTSKRSTGAGFLGMPIEQLDYSPLQKH